jgi:hypothetical protein
MEIAWEEQLQCLEGESIDELRRFANHEGSFVELGGPGLEREVCDAHARMTVIYFRYVIACSIVRGGTKRHFGYQL